MKKSIIKLLIMSLVPLVGQSSSNGSYIQTAQPQNSQQNSAPVNNGTDRGSTGNTNPGTGTGSGQSGNPGNNTTPGTKSTNGEYGNNTNGTNTAPGNSTTHGGNGNDDHTGSNGKTTPKNSNLNGQTPVHSPQ